MPKWVTYIPGAVILILATIGAAAIICLAVISQKEFFRQEAAINFKYKAGDMVECLLDDKTGMIIDSINDGGGVNEYFIRFDSSKDLVRMKEFEIMDAEK